MVRQEGDVFTAGVHPHHHSSETGAAVKAQVVRDIKENAKQNPFSSAYSIAETVLLDAPRVPNQRSVDYLGRIANYSRQATRPRHPKRLDFQLSMEFVPAAFATFDVTVGQKRHLAFATERQLGLLCSAKRWYVDATFYVVRVPFVQLWSIHAFVKSDTSVKQVPLVFVLMSSKRSADYRAVLQVIVDQLRARGSRPVVGRVIADFEAAVWQAVRTVMPHVDMRGCAFHWCQAVWRRIQHLGLQTAYNADEPFHRYCRQLLALPFLPKEAIADTFEELAAEANTDAQNQLCDYLRNTWITATIWPPSTWSVFGESVRTNNDVEGWHRRLNGKASHGQLNLYLLLRLLGGEAALVDVNVNLVKESQIVRQQRRSTRSASARLFHVWDRLVAGERSVRQTLRAASHVITTL